MTTGLTYTVHRADGTYMAACREARAAAVLVTMYGPGATIRFRYRRILWREGKDGRLTSQPSPSDVLELDQHERCAIIERVGGPGAATETAEPREIQTIGTPGYWFARKLYDACQLPSGAPIPKAVKELEVMFDTVRQERDIERAAVAALRRRVGELENDKRIMVEKAADRSLAGYRELGAKCAALEEQKDALRTRLAAAESRVAELEKTLDHEREQGNFMSLDWSARLAAAVAAAKDDGYEKGLRTAFGHLDGHDFVRNLRRVYEDYSLTDEPLIAVAQYVRGRIAEQCMDVIASLRSRGATPE